MTRFNISLTEAAKFVNFCISKMRGSEVFVPKLPSYRILDLVRAINPNKKIKYIGIRPGEKIHEELISSADSNKISEKNNHFIIDFSVKKSKENKKIFKTYNSFDNSDFLSVKEIRDAIKQNIKDFE